LPDRAPCLGSFRNLLVRGPVWAGQGQPLVAIADRIFERAVRSAGVGQVLQRVGRQCVLERAGFALAAGRDGEADELREQTGADAGRQGCDILSAGLEAGIGSYHVRWVIEQTLTVRLDGAKVELFVAGQTGPAGTQDVGAPGGVAHPGTLIEGIDADAAIKHRDEIRVGERVEDSPRPGAVDTAEYNVMV